MQALIFSNIPQHNIFRPVIKVWIYNILILALTIFIQPSSTFAQAPSITWTRIADLPEQQHVATSQVIDGYVYVVGGQNAGPPPNLNIMRIYNPSTDSWSTGPSMPTRRYLPGSGVITFQDRKELYIIGGYSGYAGLSTVERYVDDDWSTPGDGQWESVASINGSRGHGIMCSAVNNNLYAMGGFYNHDGYYNTNQMYDRENGTWTTKTPIPVSMQGALPAVYGNKIYLFGGWNNSEQFNTTLIYNTTTDSWSYGEPVPHRRNYGSAACIGDYIYLIANTSKETNKNIIDVYHPATDTWSSTDDYPGQNWSTPTIAQEDKKIYVMGTSYNEQSKLECWVGTVQAGTSQDSQRTLVFEENFDSNTNWQFNNNYSSPNFSSYPGINGWENGPLSGAEHQKNPYLNITDGVVWGCSVGYGTDPQSFEPTSIHREISVDSAGFEVEFRALSQSGWPNSVQVSLMSDWVRGESPPRHYGFIIYGESANHTIDIRSDFGDWYYRKHVGSIINNWHTYRFARLSDGTFELHIDGDQYAGFTPDPDLTYSTFNRIGISPLRQGSKIDWVKVYELTASSTTPGEISQELIIESPEKAEPGETFWVDIKAQNVSNLFGVSFVLSYSHGDYIDVETIADGLFLGHDIISYFDVNGGAHKVSMALSKKAGQDGSYGSGIVTRIEVATDSNTPDGAVIGFSLDDITANDFEGTPLTLTGIGDETVIQGDIMVWPGDTNNDGTVNQADVLPIGLYWGSTGPVRTDSSISWSGHICEPWTPEAATYADADGKGTVDQADVLPIGLNWGKTHSVAKMAAQKSGNSAGTIQPVPLGELPISAGDEFWVDIRVDEASSLLGLSFVMTYDNKDLIVPLAIESRELFGEDSIFFPRIDEETDEVAVGICLKSGISGIDGGGTVVGVKFRALREIKEVSTVTFSIRDIEAIGQTGESIQLASLDTSTGKQTELSDMSVPKEFSLRQNYPNPFNPATTISFSLPYDSRVILKIYNALGEEVATLVESIYPAGIHTVDWDASGFSSGIYFYRLEAGDFVETKKLLLLK